MKNMKHNPFRGDLPLLSDSLKIRSRIKNREMLIKSDGRLLEEMVTAGSGLRAHDGRTTKHKDNKETKLFKGKTFQSNRKLINSERKLPSL